MIGVSGLSIPGVCWPGFAFFLSSPGHQGRFAPPGVNAAPTRSTVGRGPRALGPGIPQGCRGGPGEDSQGKTSHTARERNIRDC